MPRAARGAGRGPAPRPRLPGSHCRMRADLSLACSPAPSLAPGGRLGLCFPALPFPWGPAAGSSRASSLRTLPSKLSLNLGSWLPGGEGQLPQPSPARCLPSPSTHILVL